MDGRLSRAINKVVKLEAPDKGPRVALNKEGLGVGSKEDYSIPGDSGTIVHTPSAVLPERVEFFLSVDSVS